MYKYIYNLLNSIFNVLKMSLSLVHKLQTFNSERDKDIQANNHQYSANATKAWCLQQFTA